MFRNSFRLVRAARLFSTESPKLPKTSVFSKLYSNDWVTEEAEQIIAASYRRHKPLAVTNSWALPVETQKLKPEDMEAMGENITYPAVTLGDKFASRAVRCLIPFTHAFFRDKYNHHAVVLETVAAVPGMVAAVMRHMRSLRTMRRDHGWINPLLEEAENERMHLLVWMQVTQPSLLERMLVLAAQSFYATLYASMYLFAPRIAHRFVGYLEEEAVRAYTAYLKAIDSGAIVNIPAPEIARQYYNLPDNATLRDLVLVVRADECMHRNANHHLSDMLRRGARDAEPSIFKHLPQPATFKP